MWSVRRLSSTKPHMELTSTLCKAAFICGNGFPCLHLHVAKGFSRELETPTDLFSTMTEITENRADLPLHHGAADRQVKVSEVDVSVPLQPAFPSPSHPG